MYISLFILNIIIQNFKIMNLILFCFVARVIIILVKVARENSNQEYISYNNYYCDIERLLSMIARVFCIYFRQFKKLKRLTV